MKTGYCSLPFALIALSIACGPNNQQQPVKAPAGPSEGEIKSAQADCDAARADHAPVAEALCQKVLDMRTVRIEAQEKALNEHMAGPDDNGASIGLMILRSLSMGAKGAADASKGSSSPRSPLQCQMIGKTMTCSDGVTCNAIGKQVQCSDGTVCTSIGATIECH